MKYHRLPKTNSVIIPVPKLKLSEYLTILLLLSLELKWAIDSVPTRARGIIILVKSN